MVEKQNINFINRRGSTWIDRLSESSSDIIERTGIARTTFYAMQKPGGSIKHENLYALVENYDLDLNWLFDNTEYSKKDGERSGNETVLVSEQDSVFDTDQFYAVPFYPQVKASAGDGLIPEDEKPPLQIAFRRYYITNKLQCQADDLVAIKIDGDSMAPTLLDDDIILVDKSKTSLRSGKMLVIRIDDTISCKRVQELPGRRYRVMSDNSAYESFEIRKGEPGFDIIGQVVWFGRDLI